MPELPEVEATRRGLAGPLEGARIRRMTLGKPLRWALGAPPSVVADHRIGVLQRRGKYIWMPLVADGRELAEPAWSGTPGLLWHLGMSGALRWWAGDSAPSAGLHDHVDLLTDRGLLRLTDPRRFGAVVFSPALDAAPASGLLSSLGLEPFDPQLTPARFHAELRRRRAPIKQVLLAGDIVVGAGNIYACEALFRARIHPARPAASLSRKRSDRLLAMVQATLAEAIARGGSTLRNYLGSAGEAGAYQDVADVYGREGLPCKVCGTPIRRMVQGQRATFWCPHCQAR